MNKFTPKKKFLFIFLLGIVGCLIFVFWYFKKDPTEYVKCVFSKGSYEQEEGPLGGPIIYQCVYTYSDGGKQCKNSTECQGRCLITNETQVVKVGIIESKVVGGFGRCEATNKFTGCFPGTVEDPSSAGCV